MCFCVPFYSSNLQCNLCSSSNLNALLVEQSTSDNNPQKRRKDVDSDKIVGESSVDTQLNEEVAEESEDEVNGWEDDPDYSHYNNQEEEYDYYDDDDEFF